MAGHNKSSKFEPGQVILRENTPGDSAYIILSGQVEISKVIEGQRVVLDRLGPGSIFGEMSLLDGRPRSATVTAVEPTLLSVVTSARFQAILNAIPKEVRPLFSSLSERLRHTSRMVSVLGQRERLLYSTCVLLHTLSALKGIPRDQGVALPKRDVILEAIRVLAIVHEKVEEVIDFLAGTELAKLEPGKSTEDTLFVIANSDQFGAFIDFLTEKLSHIPGFPLPSRKYSVLSDKAQEILFFLKNVADSLPRDESGRSHYDFDRYVKESVAGLHWGVKDAILNLQNLATSGHLKLVKFSELVQNKAIVYNAKDISQAQMILLQADDFERIYRKLTKG
jgi:CRP/FNR family cyclic AMP-dependent transcriptional regulator